MSRFQRELDRLRRESSTAGVPEARGPDRIPPRIPHGDEIQTPLGRHYRIQNIYPESYFHGIVRPSRLSIGDLQGVLDLAGCQIRHPARSRIVFLDTETTGMHGGTGMCPFLIGLGWFSDGEFQVRQYFIRDFDEEASMLWDLTKLLKRFKLIVTYNGRAFDAPVVENRSILARLDRPFDHLIHLDLLYTARRLWKLSQGSCRLVSLEEKLIRFDRGPDIHGSRIPAVYFDFLRSGDTGMLDRVFSHNAYDILSLASLTVLAADRINCEPQPLDDPLDVYSLARLFDRRGNRVGSVRLYEFALGSGYLPEGLRVQALERLAVLYRRYGQPVQAFACCRRLMAESTLSLAGYEGAALYYERTVRDFMLAREIVDEAIARVGRSDGHKKSLERLQSRRIRLEARARALGAGHSSSILRRAGARPAVHPAVPEYSSRR